MASGEETTAAVLSIGGRLGAAVDEACAQAGVRAVPLGDGAPLTAPACLVIAELRAGDRRVPQRVLEGVARAGGHARLLLLCAEALVRPHVATQGGRVVMVSPPHTPARLASRIRVLLADRGLESKAGSLARCERSTERFWLCSFRSGGGAQGSQVQTTDVGGLTAILPPQGGEAAPELLDEVVALLARERSDEARLRGVAQLAGACAVVHLSPAADRWLFRWPSPTWPLWVHSAQRMPPHADVAPRASRQQAWSMLAAPGDLVLACAAPLAGAKDARAALRRAAEDGGPAAVDRLGTEAERASTPASGLAVEVLG
jgi:hypothetical protein